MLSKTTRRNPSNVTPIRRRTLGLRSFHTRPPTLARSFARIYSPYSSPVKSARIILWDRAGAVVTNAFDYCNADADCDSYLVEFFWRYSIAAPKERGVDDSVSLEPLEPDEVALARQVLRDSDASLLKFHVHEGDSVKYFIGSARPFKSCASPTGRATRMFEVVDLESGTLMCLKDTWRINHSGIDKEGDIYRSLQAAEVSHIPDFVCGDDIPGQRTRTQDFTSDAYPWARHLPRRLRHHQHYRFVLRKVATELTKFSTSLELVTAMGDALQGQSFCYEKTAAKLMP
jgi:hypothetical protein